MRDRITHQFNKAAGEYRSTASAVRDAGWSISTKHLRPGIRSTLCSYTLSDYGIESHRRRIDCSIVVIFSEYFKYLGFSNARWSLMNRVGNLTAEASAKK